MILNGINLNYLDNIIKIKDKEERILKINFLYRFFMGMINVNVLQNKKYDIENKSGNLVFCNFYSGLFVNNFDDYKKEYQKYCR